VGYYGMLFLFYVCTYSVAFFFNAALAACAVASMHGEELSIAGGLRAAFARLPLIVGWGVLSATVGLVLRIIEDRSRTVGQIIAGLLGLAWSLMTFLVVPIIVVEQMGPLKAVKRSTAMLKRTWGEQVIGNFSFGLVFGLLAIPALIAVGAGVALLGSGSVVGPLVLVAGGVVYLVALGLVQATLAEVFRAALYVYATGQEPPRGFPAGMLGSAMSRRG
jgi:hypothetical protein